MGSGLLGNRFEMMTLQRSDRMRWKRSSTDSKIIADRILLGDKCVMIALEGSVRIGSTWSCTDNLRVRDRTLLLNRLKMIILERSDRTRLNWYGAGIQFMVHAYNMFSPGQFFDIRWGPG